MELISTDIIDLFIFLSPGFVTTWIYYTLTSFPKPNQFERIIQALIYTTIIQGCSYIAKIILLYIGEEYFVLGVWDKNNGLIVSICIAVLFGMVISKLTNSDNLFSLLRKWRVTNLTSYPSEWYGVFAMNKTWIVLHLNDGRRLYGWPIEWPSQPDKGHFSIIRAQWLSDIDEEEPTTLEMVKTILMPVKNVEFVEFMKMNKNEPDDYFKEKEK